MRVDEVVICELKKGFSAAGVECGYLLGAKVEVDHLNFCRELPALQAGRYFYDPDAEQANRILEEWSRESICFSGFIHSHLVNNPEFSEEDIDFGDRLVSAFGLPYFWYGLGVRRDDGRFELRFCRYSGQGRYQWEEYRIS